MNDRFVRASLAIVTLTLLIALSAYAWRGWYTRYFTDDFCSAAITRTHGFLGTMKFQREQWSGRFSYFVIKYPLEKIGPETAKFTPAAMIVLMTAAALWALRGFIRSHAFAFAIACVIAFAAVDSAPERFGVYGPFVWETGALTYMLPTILFVAWFALLVRGRAVVLSFVLMFIAGGLSETSLATQFVMTFAALFGVRRPEPPLSYAASIAKRRLWPPHSKTAIAGFLGTLSAFAIAVTAPGNDIRAQGLAPRGSLLDAIVNALGVAYRFIGYHVFVEGASLLLVAAAGAIAGAIAPALRARTAAAVALTAFACYIVAFIPSLWLVSAPPPPRAAYVAQFFLIAAVFAASAALTAQRAAALRPATAVLLLLAAVPITSTISTAKTIPEARLDAVRRESVMRLLAPHRGRDVVLRSRWALESRYLGPDKTDPNTYCIGSYYGLRSLRVER